MKLFLKGVGMGAADVVPGVSGGTIAFVTGIYEELVTSLASVKVSHIKLPWFALRSFSNASAKTEFLKMAQELNLKFLITLGAGIAISVLSLAKVIPHYMETAPFETFSLFFGLILFSIYVPYKKIHNKNALTAAIFVLIAAGSSYFFYANPAIGFPQSSIGVFLGGMVAICAMILPGISGSYLLLMMGLYRFVLDALHNKELSIILPFMAGCAVGILAFVKLLQWLLSHHRDKTLASLSGLILGSLVKVWPMAHFNEATSSINIGALMFLLGAVAMMTMIRLDPDLKAE